MDYKEKYEMALEGIQEILGSGEDSIKMSRLQLRLQGIFPELKESENEKIRKEILSFCQNKADNYPNDPKYANIGKWIAWLEKQDEQKPQRMISAEAKEAMYDKPADKAEPKFKVGDSIKTTNEKPLTITKIDDKGYWSEDLFICSFNEECIWDLAEQKPTWNKEDETYLDYIITAVKLCYPDDKDKENPWRNELLGWLKFLRTRVGYVDKWKPSEEQLKVLSYYADQNDSRGFVITSLLDDLKKLKNK